VICSSAPLTTTSSSGLRLQLCEVIVIRFGEKFEDVQTAKIEHLLKMRHLRDDWFRRLHFSAFAGPFPWGSGRQHFAWSGRQHFSRVRQSDRLFRRCDFRFLQQDRAGGKWRADRNQREEDADFTHGSVYSKKLF